MQQKDAGMAHVTRAVEKGERLYPHTAADGREAVRQQLRVLKTDWDSLYDEVLSSQRHLEISLFQWTSFEESRVAMETWLHAMDSRMSEEVVLRATLEEKKTQLQTYKVWCRSSVYY